MELLKGIRVMEAAVLVAGDTAGCLMGDLGADVIKVEQPGVGDYIRDLGGNIGPPRHSPYHLLLNRNKRSISLNLRSDEGRAIFFELLADTDIFIDGFASDACPKLGIGYEDQIKVKPDIIYLQVSGFGANGAYAEIPTHGVLMNAAAGSIRLEVGADGFVKELPPPAHLVHPGQPNGMLNGSLFGALTALAALDRRHRTGTGAYIDSSCSDAVVAAQGMDATGEWNLARTTPDPNPPISPGLATVERPKYAYYQTKDGAFLMFAGIEHKFWKNFCDGIGREDLWELRDAKAPCDFRVPPGGEGLADELRRIFLSRTRAEWIDFAALHDVPIGPANQRDELLDDPNLRSRDFISKSEHPHAGPFVSFGWPCLVSGDRFEVRHGAPRVGEQTEAILASLGKSESDIERLKANAVV
jgi:crotonobetainyl-CoA:carnitine CoA-transferase CaiB-like acyl-CoA transferase